MKKTISFMILLFTLAIIIRIKTIKNNKNYNSLKEILINWKSFSKDEKDNKKNIKKIISSFNKINIEKE
jgi:hypothetical protein